MDVGIHTFMRERRGKMYEDIPLSNHKIYIFAPKVFIDSFSSVHGPGHRTPMTHFAPKSPKNNPLEVPFLEYFFHTSLLWR